MKKFAGHAHHINPDFVEELWVEVPDPISPVEETAMITQYLLEEFGSLQIDCSDGKCRVTHNKTIVNWVAPTLLEALRMAATALPYVLRIDANAQE